MKKYTTPIALIISLILFTSCLTTGENEQEKFTATSQVLNADPSIDNTDIETETAMQNNLLKNSQNATQLVTIKDQKTGMPFYTVPLPQGWAPTYNSKEWSMQGPNNINISKEFGQNFSYGDPYSYNNTPPMDNRQIINQYYEPIAIQYQRKLITTYELPKVAEVNQYFRQNLWSYAPTQKTTKAFATEWEDANNTKFIIVTYVTNDTSQFGNFWSFYGSYLEAPAAYFNEAKKAFLFGLESIKYNPQWIAQYNQNEIQKAGIRDAAFQKRLAAIQTRNNNTSIGDTYSDILDINHKGYLTRNNINNAGQSNAISGIRETVNIVNNNTGENYTVPMGSNYYWVNNEGVYFGTNNSNYNPNTDQRVYDKEWTKFEINNNN